MLTIQEINRAIITGNFTNDQLISITDAIKFARSQLMRQNRRELTIGDRVKFRGRGGMIETGNITKIMVKKALVNTGVLTWRVPMSMLESV